MKDLISMGLKSMPVSDAGCIRDRGFTLIELLVTMAIASIVMAVIYSFYAGMTRSYTTHNAAADAQQAVRATIDLIAEDIMMAGFDSNREGVAGFVSISDKSMEFTSDRDMDGEIKDTVEYERIIYNYDANSKTLEYKMLGTDDLEPLIDKVTDLSFVYLDADGNETANLDAIRTVEISMKVMEPAGREQDERMKAREYTTQVKCRNLGLFD